MAVKYVSSSASGSDDGTSATHTGGTTGPWTLTQMLSATPSAGDEIRIMADGIYSITAAKTISYANGTAAANILVTGANSSGVVDGTMPTFQASGASITMLTVTGDHIMTQYLLLDGNNQINITGFYLNATYSRCRWIKAYRTTVYGVQIAGSSALWGENLQATACSGTAGIYLDGGEGYFIESYANSCTGIVMNTRAKIDWFLSYSNSGGSSCGIAGSSSGFRASNGVCHGNGSHGVDITGNSGDGTLLVNVIVQGNSGAGFGTDGVKSGARLLSCAGGNNTSGNYNATNLPNVFNFVDLGSNDPFKNEAGNNFSLNNLTGGKLLRAAGIPGTYPRGTTTGYADIGAVQHADPAVNVIQHRRRVI